MNTQAQSLIESGRGQGFEDACEWIHDLRTSEHKSDAAIADALRVFLRSPCTADESLVNSLSTHDLSILIGHDAYDADGDMTPEATEWLSSYNLGWVSAVEDRLTKIEAP